MATQIAPVEADRALDNFKSMGTREVDMGAPRAMFLPATMGDAMELARLMSGGNFVPPHLRGKPGDCLAVIMQATRWGMDPFAVGNKTYFVNDRMAYESQLVNAVINSAHVLDGRLHPTWSGEGNDLVCRVTGKLKGDQDVKERKVAIKNITTRNSPLWKQDPEQQLAYFTMRAWVRLHAPEVLLGVYTPDELADVRQERAEPAAGSPLTGAMLIAQAAPAKGANSLAEELGDSIPAFDHDASEGVLTEDNPTAEEGPPQDQRGEANNDADEEPAWRVALRGILSSVANAKTLKAVETIERDWTNRVLPGVPDDAEIRAVEADITAKKRALKAKAEG